MIKHRPPTAASAICLIVLTHTHTLSILTSDLGLLTAQRATGGQLISAIHTNVAFASLLTSFHLGTIHG